MSPSLTATTVEYLFASTWAPADSSAWSVYVPGGRVAGLDLGANLLNLAFWSLRVQSLVDLSQLRPVEKVTAEVMGGSSFARVLPSAGGGDGAEGSGLEGAVLAAIRARAESESVGEDLARRLAGDDEAGVRSVVLSLHLHSSSPWSTIAQHCADEARAAGVLQMRGRSRPKPVVDQSVLTELEPRDAEIVAARAAYREESSDLDAAVIGDCLAALLFAHHTPN